MKRCLKWFAAGVALALAAAVIGAMVDALRDAVQHVEQPEPDTRSQTAEKEPQPVA